MDITRQGCTKDGDPSIPLDISQFHVPRLVDKRYISNEQIAAIKSDPNVTEIITDAFKTDRNLEELSRPRLPRVPLKKESCSCGHVKK